MNCVEPDTEPAAETNVVSETEFVPEMNVVPETDPVPETKFVPEMNVVPETDPVPDVNRPQVAAPDTVNMLAVLISNSGNHIAQTRSLLADLAAEVRAHNARTDEKMDMLVAKLNQDTLDSRAAKRGASITTYVTVAIAIAYVACAGIAKAMKKA